MAQDKSKDIFDYLGLWLSRHKSEAELIPLVQRAYDEAQWQHKTWTAVNSSAPDMLRADVEARLDFAFEQLKTNLPLPPEYGSFVSSGVANTMTGAWRA